ncbi:MAG: cobalamin-dependent protein, partial [Magnetococcales bacterium]|nr:cobalamin-dependent protein [Magnetococcales bacterium]
MGIPTVQVVPVPLGTGENASLAAWAARLRREKIRNRRVLLVQTPQLILDSFDREIALRRGYYNFPPTGLQYLYESLRGMGLEVTILNLNHELLKRVCDDPDFAASRWLEILGEALDRYAPSVVGVSCMFDTGIAALLAILGELRRRDEAVVVAGGLIPTYEWQSLLDRDLAHFTVAGEGEERFPFLLGLLFDGVWGEAMGGIRFCPDGEIMESRGVTRAAAFDRDLVASYAEVRIEEHHLYGSLNPFARMAGLASTPFAAIQFQRGCRARCTFCAVPGLMGKGVRSRALATVLAEMAFLI